MFGYASGRFNEIINIARDDEGCTYDNLNCNAKNFIERAEADGLEIGDEPRLGAIMCWGNSGAGHVAVVERVDDDNQVYTSESGWGSSAIFWNQIRTNDNGRWGCASNYWFRGFIYLPDDVQEIIEGGSPDPGPEPTPPEPGPCDEFEIGDEVILNGPIYVSSDSTDPAGEIDDRQTTITRKIPGALHPYNTEGDLGWCDEDSLTRVEDEPTDPDEPSEDNGDLQIGDQVEIVGTGNGSADGSSNTAYGIGWVREILDILDGEPYPYQVGNDEGTTGWYDADALEKI